MKSKLSLIMIISILMTSCYSSIVNHGNTNNYTPMIKVASKKNPIILWGLLPLGGANQNASDFLGERTDYRTKNYWTFVDGLLNFITIGIYTPTTTAYYLPFEGNLSEFKGSLKPQNDQQTKKPQQQKEQKRKATQQQYQKNQQTNRPQQQRKKTTQPRRDTYQYYGE